MNVQVAATTSALNRIPFTPQWPAVQALAQLSLADLSPTATNLVIDAQSLLHDVDFDLPQAAAQDSLKLGADCGALGIGPNG